MSEDEKHLRLEIKAQSADIRECLGINKDRGDLLIKLTMKEIMITIIEEEGNVSNPRVLDVIIDKARVTSVNEVFYMGYVIGKVTALLQLKAESTTDAMEILRDAAKSR